MYKEIQYSQFVHLLGKKGLVICIKKSKQIFIVFKNLSFSRVFVIPLLVCIIALYFWL